MGFYDTYCLPAIINLACSTKPIRKQREKVVPFAQGRVLEIGMGSALNLPFYDSGKVEFIWGLEPSQGMRRKAQENLAKSSLEVKWLDLEAEQIPLEDKSVDTVVLTYTLCTIPDWHGALRQMRRVLKPGGKLLFTEHGKAPDMGVARWQDRLNPIWKKVCGGCNLNRPMPQLIVEGGFRMEELNSMYLPSTPRIAGYHYWGVAGR